jgi:hypothetical protein
MKATALARLIQLSPRTHRPTIIEVEEEVLHGTNHATKLSFPLVRCDQLHVHKNNMTVLPAHRIKGTGNSLHDKCMGDHHVVKNMIRGNMSHLHSSMRHSSSLLRLSVAECA